MTGERSKTEMAVWIGAAAVLLLLAWKLLAPGGGAAAGTPVSVPSEPARSSGPGRAVYVHVVGRVHDPGLYSLRAGARIARAIERAGGPAPGADLSAVNLAMKVQDGQQILVPRRGAAPAVGGQPAGGAGGGRRISLATATVEQLDQLDGIGPTLAKRIVDYREQHGGFRSVDELKQVDGIGQKRFAALEDAVGP